MTISSKSAWPASLDCQIFVRSPNRVPSRSMGLLKSEFSLSFFLASVLCFSFIASRLSAAPKATVLYTLPGGTLGASPMASLFEDSARNLYGTSFGANKKTGAYGSVFKLTPPAVGATNWTASILYSFRNTGDGANPASAVVMDKAGNLYGTTSDGGDGGRCVFKLEPPAAGQGAWIETVIYSVAGNVYGNLLMTPSGVIYGVDTEEVFSLAPPTSKMKSWTPTVLYNFPPGVQIYAGVVNDASGALYGTTSQGGAAGLGTVYKLTPPSDGQDSWTETDLHVFQGGANDGAMPMAGVVVDVAGNLYGTTEYGGSNNAGTVFMLTPPAGGQGTWSESVLHRFSGSDGAYPLGSLTKTASGIFYGTTSIGGSANDGTVFKLVPPLGGNSWTLVTLYAFTGRKAGNPLHPEASLIRDKTGVLYGTTVTGATTARAGTAFAITP
jgi:uncharacterized repeat protein (TIGR03803 family)